MVVRVCEAIGAPVQDLVTVEKHNPTMVLGISVGLANGLVSEGNAERSLRVRNYGEDRIDR